MITKQELADGIRFAGQRAAAAARNTKDWDHQLGHQWTSRDAFCHIAATAGGAEGFVPMLETPVLSSLGAEQIGAMNAGNIAQWAAKSQDEVAQAIIDGSNKSAAFVETLDGDDLAKVIKLGGYEMPKGEILAQIFIHHSIAHAYEASARWPLL